jgi:hypothetical protein
LVIDDEFDISNSIKLYLRKMGFNTYGFRFMKVQTPNEKMAKSVSGKIEWLASFGSLLRLDAISRYIPVSGVRSNYSKSKESFPRRNDLEESQN